MGFITRLRFNRKLGRIQDPYERQRVTLEWFADHPQEIASEFDAAAAGLDTMFQRAVEEGDKGLLRAVSLAKAWLEAAVPGGVVGGAALRKIGDGTIGLHRRVFLIHAAFVGVIVREMVALQEDASTALRRLEGEYFAMQRRWFLNTYPEIAETFDGSIERRAAVSDSIFESLK